MTEPAGHPMRKAPIHVFKRCDGGYKGVNYIARFYPYDTYPVYFHGESQAEAIAAAEVLRSEAIDKFEKGIIARQIATIKAIETRARKALEKKNKGVV